MSVASRRAAECPRPVGGEGGAMDLARDLTRDLLGVPPSARAVRPAEGPPRWRMPAGTQGIPHQGRGKSGL